MRRKGHLALSVKISKEISQKIEKDEKEKDEKETDSNGNFMQ